MKYRQTDNPNLIYLKQLAKKAFQYQAKLVLKKYRPKIIAITGSVGKTLTRDAVYAVLSKKFYIRKSERSFSAELGVPLTILGFSSVNNDVFEWVENILYSIYIILFKVKYPEWIILEIDANKPGELQTISSMVSPDILVVTAIGEVPSHIESFYEKENFISEKKILLNSVKRDGVIIYNADDIVTANLLNNSLVKLVACGVGEGNTVKGGEISILYGKGSGGQVPTGMSFDISWNGEMNKITILESIGVHKEYASLLAFAVGLEFKLTPKEISSSLNKIKISPGRMRILQGIKDSTIIDDSYNASPIAMSQAIDILGRIKVSGRKIAVLGDMLELGKYSADEHRKIADILIGKADIVFTAGFRSRKIIEGLLNKGFGEDKARSYDDAISLGKDLQNFIQKGDILLVKGSQDMRMEMVVEEIMRYPKDKKKFLVRQTEWWEKN